MQITNKKAIVGITLATILVAVVLTFMPQNANADLTALDKIGTIINIITGIQGTVNNIETIVLDIQNTVNNIQNTVNNIFGEVTDPGHGLEEIKNEVSNTETIVTSQASILTRVSEGTGTYDTSFTSPRVTRLTCDKDVVVVSYKVFTTSNHDDDDFILPEHLAAVIEPGGFSLANLEQSLAAGLDIDVEIIGWGVGGPIGLKAGDKFRVLITQTAGDDTADSLHGTALVLAPPNTSCSIIVQNIIP
ncbi:MAG: hypothetical protein ACRD38_06930 [Nitrososphaerales archaeon]